MKFIVEILEGPVHIILMILGILFIVISFLDLKKIKFLPIPQRLRYILRILGIILFIVGLMMKIFLPSSNIENCKSISPNFISLENGAEVNDFKIDMQGSVKKRPENNELWIVVKDLDLITKNYCDCKRISINNDNKWKTNISLTGGMRGHDFLLAIYLASRDLSFELEKLDSKRFESLPRGLIFCKSITVRLK